MSDQHRSSSPHPPTSAFFPIPILPHVLTSYENIPAPVILPPRSDPSSFFNPSLHRHQLMDCDPFVLDSRTQIDTKTFDLTESEHAGVILSKPATMVSDIVRSTSANIMVYDVICDSEKLSNMHLNNAQELTVSSTIDHETPSPVADDSLDQRSEKKNQDLFVCNGPELVSDCLKLAAVQEGETSTEPVAQSTMNGMAVTAVQNQNMKSFVCEICNVTCNKEKVLNKHKKGRRHLNNLRKLSVSSINTLNQKPEKPKQDSLFFSRIPDPVFDHPNVVSEQVPSGMKNVNKSDKIPDVPSATTSLLRESPNGIADKPKVKEVKVVNSESNSLRCELCGIRCTSHKQLKEHMIGKKHAFNVKKTENSPSPAAPAAKSLLQDLMSGEGKDVFSQIDTGKDDTDANSLASDENADRKRQKLMVKEDAGFDVLLTCKVCNVACEGLMVYNYHVATREHAAMAQKHAIGGRS